MPGLFIEKYLSLEENNLICMGVQFEGILWSISRTWDYWLIALKSSRDLSINCKSVLLKIGKPGKSWDRQERH